MGDKFATVDMSGLERKLLEFSVVMDKAPHEVLMSQGKKAAEELAELTPPTGNEPFTEKFATQRAFGERAVERDINKVFKQIQDIHLRDLDADKRLQTYARREEYDKIQTMLKRLGFTNPIAAFPTERTHNAARGSGGRVRKKVTQTFIVRPGTVKEYRDRKKRLVGLAKSGISRAAGALGFSLPSWVSRHSGPGVFVDQSRAKLNPFIVLGNTVQYIQSAAARLRIVSRVVERRKIAMRNQMDAYLKKSFRGYK